MILQMKYRLTKTKKGYKADSYSRVREILKEMLKSVESNFLLRLYRLSSVGVSAVVNSSAADQVWQSKGCIYQEFNFMKTKKDSDLRY